MSMPEVKRFYREIGSLTEMREQLTASADPETGLVEPGVIVETAANAGFEFTADELIAYDDMLRADAAVANSGAGATLSDAELESVAGGVEHERVGSETRAGIVQAYPAVEYYFTPRR